MYGYPVNLDIILRHQHQAIDFRLAIFVSILARKEKVHLFQDTSFIFLPSIIRLIVVLVFKRCVKRESGVAGSNHASERSLTSGGRAGF